MKLNNTRGEGRGARDESQKSVRASTLDARRSTARCGVALVITVILLAMVTLLAITFLGVTRRQRNAVTTTTDTATAQYAANDALAAAEAQIVANTLATTNPYTFGLLVSTNYINRNGFDPNVVGYSPTNVNYDYQINGNPLTPDQFLQNLANLYYLPRAPVFIPTNSNPQYPLDFRYYLDLNRNGRDEPNGVWPVISPDPNNPYYYYNPNNPGDPRNGQTMQNIIPGDTLSNLVVGDPEWVGILQHPDQPYGPDNPFVARYAFIAVPIGNTLDLNAIYNQAASGTVNPASLGDGFMRNQGVGSWEINLAAFLADLNTNAWLPVIPPDNNYYAYDEPGGHNWGIAFDDALSLLSYRYGFTYNSLDSPIHLFAFDFNTGLPKAVETFPYGNVDIYGSGPLMTSTAGINVGNQRMNRLWAGAANTNQFFDPQELFDPSESSVVFTNRLLSAGTNFSTYDRYTYYRWLSQMGVDSAPEQDQINLNYSNAAAYFFPDGVLSNVTYYPDAETNLVPWQPLQFFTIAADRMLRTYSEEWLTESPSNYVATYGVTTNISTDPIAYPTNVPTPFGLSDIPVLVSNRFVYTPAIQRVLQLAANIYDATTNNTAAMGTNFPSVFRPIFRVTYDPSSGYTNLYIAGYEPVQTLVNGVEQIGAVSGPGDYQLGLPVDVNNLLNPSYQIPYYGYFTVSTVSGIYTNINVYGVPWIIGAKKGFPNFNEFAMESAFQLTRKVQVTRNSTNDNYTFNPDHYHFNQMFNLSLSNQFGVECWNSYTNNFLRSVAIYVTDTNSCLLTNNLNFSTSLGSLISGSLLISSASNNNNGWPGFNPAGNTRAVFWTPASFQLPLNTNVAIVTNSTYRFNVAGSYQEPGHIGPYLTTNLNLPFEQNVDINGNLYPQPDWWLMTTNNVRVIILDTTDPSAYHVIDYVQLAGPTTVRQLTSEIMQQYDTEPGPGGNAMWDTNMQSGLPMGIVSQMGVSDGNYTAGAASGVWNATSDTERHNEINGFSVFLGYSPPYSGGAEAIAIAKMTNAMQMPYSPSAMVIQYVDWQVNDPLVHYLADDVNQPGVEPTFRAPPTGVPDLTNSSYTALSQQNKRYAPWGLSMSAPPGVDANPYNLALKDPLTRRSDDWDFPTYKLPTIGWLGRVHRGTPWQTVYLKAPDILREIHVVTNFNTVTSTNIGTNTWVWWTGDTNWVAGRYFYDAANTAPAQDRLLFDLFTTAPNANATRGQLSVNVDASEVNTNYPATLTKGLAAWSALFSGVQVLSNNAVNSAVNLAIGAPQQHNGSLANFISLPIDPAGPVGANAAVAQLVAGINETRANANNAPWISSMQVLGGGVTIADEIPASFANANGVGNAFEHVGDILAVPQLTTQSRFLNTGGFQQQNGISDEMYEWLPQQVLSLLRVSGTPQSPMRYVIYYYGQALKPAPGGIYTGNQTIYYGRRRYGSLFGMITNYQVVAESASRAVVNFGSVVTNVITTNADDVWISVPVVTNNTAQFKGPPQPLPPY